MAIEPFVVLEPFVVADWSLVIPEALAWDAAAKWASAHLDATLRSEFKREIALARARHQKEVNARLAKLPEHRRQAAEAALDRILRKHYGDSQERIATIVNVMLDAFELDEYWAVLSAIDDSARSDIARLAEILDEFGIVDIANIGHQARSRMRFLDELERIVTNDRTLEKEVHRAVEANLWLFGPQYGLVASNKTLRRIADEYLDSELATARLKHRPDLLLTDTHTGGHLLIEFKRPALHIDRDDENQARKYRDDLAKRFSHIRVLVLGKGRAVAVAQQYDDPTITVTSYAELVSRSRSEINWLLSVLRDKRS